MADPLQAVLKLLLLIGVAAAARRGRRKRAAAADGAGAPRPLLLLLLAASAAVPLLLLRLAEMRHSTRSMLRDDDMVGRVAMLESACFLALGKAVWVAAR